MRQERLEAQQSLPQGSNFDEAYGEKMLDEFNQGQALKIGIPSSDNFSLCQLPPLDPATPSIKSALKKMFKMTSSPSSSPPPQNGKYDDESVSQHSSDDGLGIGVEGIDKINLYEWDELKTKIKAMELN